MNQLLAEERAVPDVCHRHSSQQQGSEVNFLKYLSTHIKVIITVTIISVTFHSPHPITSSPAIRSVSQEDNTVTFWEVQEVLPPLLKEDSVFRETKVHEGFGNCFDHWRGSAQETQSPLQVHMSTQLILCDSPAWGNTKGSQLIKTQCCGTNSLRVAHVEL